MIYKIHPLSESAITVYFEQKVSEEINNQVLSAKKWIEENPFAGLLEVVPAIASFTVFYDLLEVKRHCEFSGLAFDFVKAYLENMPWQNLPNFNREVERVEIPVRYNGPDLELVAAHCQKSVEQIVEMHTAAVYRVFMMGFLPGFAYLGGMNKALATPRKAEPRLRVKAGSVGIAGEQTGVYPLDSPGGWQIIGETDLKLFDPNETELSLLKAGDEVVFRAV
ncbi:5-oxoprolinase subunit PxpB [Marinilongibacter aquaticus]|uniref:5-oxoprolinase subunit PxpB n=1 Tax=Marinilongibacter aquaticus TaxID=2975157 RepID=UPI0021BD27CB|nr:5-oxoprolinase subunit PxpB [Marinilongibacter aquaticus]UBM58481.1 5-oxoprolinase subunit PxpB [Marinilongibacter aquaticus]